MADDALDQPEDDAMELVMPFVVVQSVGGPYDDDAFAFGWQAGAIDHALRVADPEVRSVCYGIVRAGIVPQVELIGMRHGFPVVTVEPTAEGWCEVTFERGQTQ